MTHATSGVIGTDFSSTSTTPKFALGHVVEGENGSRWMYVLASGAITQYDYVCIDEDYTARAGTKANVDAGHSIGFAQVAFASADYGWVAMQGRGNISVRTADSTSADVALYTTATAGVVSSTSTSQTQIKSLVAVAANSSGGVAAREVIATHPFGV